MEQDEKIYLAALARGSTSTSVRTVSADDGMETRREGALSEVVGSASAMDPHTPQRALELPEPEVEARGLARERRVEGEAPQGDKLTSAKTPKKANNVRKIRIERMMSKAELARRANLSVLTIDRVERGYGCRVDTKRKILEALGLSLADRVRVFGEEE